MALVVAGTVAPMAAGAEDQTFRGKVWLGDDGRVEQVTRRGETAPSGFDAAPLVDVGDAVVYPGFVDLHSHLGYNTLPLWSDRTQTQPYAHHDSWPDGESYKTGIPWPAWTLADQAPECLLAYIQVRALAGGTTAAQGWPGLSRPPTNRLVRSVDHDAFGPLDDPVVQATLPPLSPADLADKAAALAAGKTFVYHCAEGQPGSKVTGEFDDLARPGCLRRGLVAVHCCALDATHFERWRREAKPRAGSTAGTVVWSPFSNLWLYGITTQVPEALTSRLGVALGTDWGPSGTKNLLGEIKVARLWADQEGWGLSDFDLARMITSVPGDALAHAWRTRLGRLQPGALGDITVVARRKRDVWANLVGAHEADVVLVCVEGQARYGSQALMDAAGQRATTAVRIGTATRRVMLVRPDDPATTWTWADVLARLDAVRDQARVTPPRGHAGAVRASRRVVPLAGDPPGTPPLAASLDMPSGAGRAAGPPPKGRKVEIAPIQPLHHSRAWLASIRGRGFHGGVLDGLAAFYR